MPVHIYLSSFFPTLFQAYLMNSPVLVGAKFKKNEILLNLLDKKNQQHILLVYSQLDWKYQLLQWSLEALGKYSFGVTKLMGVWLSNKTQKWRMPYLSTSVSQQFLC